MKISHKLAQNSEQSASDLHRESLSPYRIDNGLERIPGESRITYRPTFARF